MYQKFINSDLDEKYKLAIFGKYFIDFQLLKVMLTVNSKKTSEHFDVVRGDSHKRVRPSVFGKKGTHRLNTVMTPKSLDIHLVQSFGQYNFLGILWLKKNKYVFPTFNEIMKGLVSEAKDQIRFSSGLQAAIARSGFSANSGLA